MNPDLPENQMYNKWLYRFAIVTAIVAVFLIVAGATVTSTGSGDAVPDWPLSYGTLNPPMTGGIFYEHGHRLIAGLTGILIAILAIWLWKIETRAWLKRLGFLALLAVVIQAVLGGLRVLIVSTDAVQETAIQLTGNEQIDQTRIAIAITHAFLAQSVLCMVFAIGVFTSRSWLETTLSLSKEDVGIKLTVLGIGLVGLIFLQLILGAFVRHTEAGLIIPDFPLSFGRIIPPFGDLPNNPNAPFPITDNEMFFKVAVHFAHRIVAYLILALVIFLFVKFRTTDLTGKFIKMLFPLTIIQVILGAMNIWTAKSVYSTVPHVVIGALILANSIILVLWSWKKMKSMVTNQ